MVKIVWRRLALKSELVEGREQVKRKNCLRTIPSRREPTRTQKLVTSMKNVNAGATVAVVD